MIRLCRGAIVVALFAASASLVPVRANAAMPLAQTHTVHGVRARVCTITGRWSKQPLPPIGTRITATTQNSCHTYSTVEVWRAADYQVAKVLRAYYGRCGGRYGCGPFQPIASSGDYGTGSLTYDAMVGDVYSVVYSIIYEYYGGSDGPPTDCSYAGNISHYGNRYRCEISDLLIVGAG